MCPSYIYQKCKVQIVSLKKAAADLKPFEQLASCFRSTQKRAQGPLKRPKCTSSGIEVLPDTVRETQVQAIQKERLEFKSEMHTRFPKQPKIINECRLSW